MQKGDTLEIMLDTEQYFTTTLLAGTSTLIVISSPLPYSTGNLSWSGNIVTDLGGGSGSIAVSPLLLENESGSLLLESGGISLGLE